MIHCLTVHIKSSVLIFLVKKVVLTGHKRVKTTVLKIGTPKLITMTVLKWNSLALQCSIKCIQKMQMERQTV